MCPGQCEPPPGAAATPAQPLHKDAACEAGLLSLPSAPLHACRAFLLSSTLRRVSRRGARARPHVRTHSAERSLSDDARRDP